MVQRIDRTLAHIRAALPRAGLVDQAELRIIPVNRADPARGALAMRRGGSGEVVPAEQGMVRRGRHGRTQALWQGIGALPHRPRGRVPEATLPVDRGTPATAACSTCASRRRRPCRPPARSARGAGRGRFASR